MAMYSFFDEYDLSNKTIITFNTSGGSAFSDTINTTILHPFHETPVCLLIPHMQLV